MAGAGVALLPHIMLILVDDWGWNNVGYHRSGQPLRNETHTPTIDALAASGVQLGRMYSPCCTLPTYKVFYLAAPLLLLLVLRSLQPAACRVLRGTRWHQVAALPTCARSARAPPAPAPPRLARARKLDRQRHAPPRYAHQWCGPSRNSLMSGRLPDRIGGTNLHEGANPDGLPRNISTIASKLRDAGYSSAMVGKWGKSSTSLARARARARAPRRRQRAMARPRRGGSAARCACRCPYRYGTVVLSLTAGC